MTEAIRLVELAVSQLFSVNLSDIRGRERKRHTSNARALIWFVLHYDYNMSSNKIAIEYQRTRRDVCMQVSNMKFLIEKNATEKENYQKVLQFIKEKERDRSCAPSGKTS